MPYIRLSIARPRRGEEKRLEEIMRKLAEASAGEEGCLEAYVLRPHDESGEIARISVYRDEAAGTAAANSARILALRSEMHLIVEPGHTERAFFSM